jgi:peptide/nickel transport system permease protein
LITRRYRVYLAGAVWRFVVRRILWAGVLFLGVTFVTFVLFFVAPESPQRAVCGGNSAKQACMDEATHRLGLDRPIAYQYGLFLKRLVIDRSLGTSFITRQSVNHIIGQAAPVTASLVFGGAILWLMIGLVVGIFSALRPRSLLDRAGMIFVLVGVSAHPLWIGLIFSYFFGYKLRNFPLHTPIAGYADFFSPPPGQPGGPVQWFYHMILPWTTFAILFAALYARMIRANVMETMNEDYVRTARAKGAPEARVLRSHVLRNALLPVVTMLGMDIGLALGGAIFTESVYNLPGLGNTALLAVSNYDLTVVQGVVIFATLAIIVFNLIVDILYAWIDPRIRLT